MKISEILSRRKAFPSLEIVPPSYGVEKQELLRSIRPLMEFNPPYINVTCHRDRYELWPQEEGGLRKVLVRNKVDQTAVCAAVQAEFDVEVVPHLICAGASREETESQLHNFKFLGINNILALRGDALPGEDRFTPEEGGYAFAFQLVESIRRFESCNGGGFCIGVAGYPEKHREAPDMASDIQSLKRKVDAGADFIITQMFFDNNLFYRFRDKCDAAGIRVPIIPGLKPLSNARQTERIPRSFSLEIPSQLSWQMHGNASDADACYRIGQEWCSRQCADLLQNGVPAVHFYTMSRSENVVGVLRECF